MKNNLHAKLYISFYVNIASYVNLDGVLQIHLMTSRIYKRATGIMKKITVLVLQQ